MKERRREEGGEGKEREGMFAFNNKMIRIGVPAVAQQ